MKGEWYADVLTVCILQVWTLGGSLFVLLFWGFFLQDWSIYISNTSDHLILHEYEILGWRCL